MDAELTMLTTTAAETLVRAMTREGWDRVKDAVTALWHRAHPDRAATIAAELDEARSAAQAALAGGPQHAAPVEADLVAEWQGRLRRLVAADPALAAELRRLVEPSGALGGTVDRSVHISATASDHARINVSGRDMHISDH